MRKQRALIISTNEREAESIKNTIQRYEGVHIDGNIELIRGTGINGQLRTKARQDYKVCFIPSGTSIKDIETIHSENPHAKIAVVGLNNPGKLYSEESALRLAQLPVYKRTISEPEDFTEALEDFRQNGVFYNPLAIAVFGFGKLAKILATEMAKDPKHFSRIHLYGSSAFEVNPDVDHRHSYQALLDAKGMDEDARLRLVTYRRLTDFAKAAANSDVQIMAAGKFIKNLDNVKARGTPDAEKYDKAQLRSTVEKISGLIGSFETRELKIKSLINPLSNPNGAASSIVLRKTGIDPGQISSITVDHHRAKRSVAFELNSRRGRYLDLNGDHVFIKYSPFYEQESRLIQRKLEDLIGREPLTADHIEGVRVYGEHHFPIVNLEQARVAVGGNSIRVYDLIDPKKIESEVHETLCRLAYETFMESNILGIEASEVPNTNLGYLRALSEFRDTDDSRYKYFEELGAFLQVNGDMSLDNLSRETKEKVGEYARIQRKWCEEELQRLKVDAIV